MATKAKELPGGQLTHHEKGAWVAPAVDGYNAYPCSWNDLPQRTATPQKLEPHESPHFRTEKQAIAYRHANPHGF